MRTLSDDADRHGAEIDERGHTVVEELGITPADNGFEGRSTYRVYTLLVHGEVFHRRANGATRLGPGSHRDLEYPAYGRPHDTMRWDAG